MRDRTDSLAATHSRHACPPPCVSSQVPSSNKSSPQVNCIASRGHTGQQQEYEATRKPVAESRRRGEQQQRSALPKGPPATTGVPQSVHAAAVSVCDGAAPSASRM